MVLRKGLFRSPSLRWFHSPIQAQIPMYEGPYRQPNEYGDSIDSGPNSVGSTSIFRQTTELETCIWRPPNIKIPEHKIQEFVEKCYLDHGWAEEQALGILYVRKFNFRRAMDTTKTFEPMPCVMDSFTEDDRNAFFSAYKLHSRQFSKLKGTHKEDMKISKIKGIGKKTLWGFLKEDIENPWNFWSSTQGWLWF